ncbi:hypothetical protein V8B55DRAFT_1541963 [Mucor lusitanicus]
MVGYGFRVQAFPCPICTWTFKRKTHLFGHLRIVHDVEPVSFCSFHVSLMASDSRIPCSLTNMNAIAQIVWKISSPVERYIITSEMLIQR